MESFMYAPVGVFAGRNNGDADSFSAPHCKQSIATRALGGNPESRRRALTRCRSRSYSAISPGGHSYWASRMGVFGLGRLRVPGAAAERLSRSHVPGAVLRHHRDQYFFLPTTEPRARQDRKSVV